MNEQHRPPIGDQEAAIIYAHAQRITAYIASGTWMPDGAAIPPAVATWGDARMLFPSLLALLSHLYPQLKDAAALESLLHEYMTAP